MRCCVVFPTNLVAADIASFLVQGWDLDREVAQGNLCPSYPHHEWLGSAGHASTGSRRRLGWRNCLDPASYPAGRADQVPFDPLPGRRRALRLDLAW